ENAMYTAYMDMIAPISETGTLQAILFQFPPYFNCTKETVTYLKYIASKMGDLPVAVEFRHNSWYNEQNTEKTLELLRELGFIHTVVDEPQGGAGSVPIVLRETNSDM
ncbi:DUF72 domain-containing protein, partial [Listeria monocytogenes]|nr:DUF72 domain-containing protein [Listeria monocytogenes]